MPSPINEGFTTQPTATTNFTTQLNDILKKKTDLDKYIDSGLTADINAASSTFLSYVGSAGKTTNMYDALQPIRNKLTEYNTTVAQPLSTLRTKVLTDLNVNKQSAELTAKYQRLDRLKKELAELDVDASTAYLREAAIDTRKDAVSFQQTWGYLNRPLRRNSIAILIIFALIFAGAAVYGLYYMNSGIDEVSGMVVNPIKAIATSSALIVIGIIVALKLMKQV